MAPTSNHTTPNTKNSIKKRTENEIYFLTPIFFGELQDVECFEREASWITSSPVKNLTEQVCRIIFADSKLETLAIFFDFLNATHPIELESLIFSSNKNNMETYKLKYQCGQVYSRGNLEFSQDGSSLLSIVGSRINIYDLSNQTCRTVKAEARSEIKTTALSPDQQILLIVDSEGFAEFIQLKNDTVLSYFNFHGEVQTVKFSPEGRFLAAAVGPKLYIYESFFKTKYGVLLPFLNFSSWHTHDITHLNFWDTFLITSSKDQTIRFCYLVKSTNYIPLTLTGHRKPVLGAYPLKNLLFSVSEEARVFVWQWKEASVEFLERQVVDYKRRSGRQPNEPSNTKQLVLINKHQLQHEGVFNLTCCDMKENLLVAGFRTGNFALYSVEQKEISVLHTLNMSEYEVSSISINSTGDWLAFGSSVLGQLLVWEWKSESYILRQMGHSSQLMTAACSGNLIATGGIDGKIKLWENGLCFSTFNEHTNGIVDLVFTNTNAVISASLDGTVRAFDITRYRQFRVLTTKIPVQFTCLAVDSSAEIVCSGASDYCIYVWALPTGVLCEKLEGHTGPISCLVFRNTSNALISGSWDGTIKVWDVFESKGSVEPIEIGGEVICLALRFDGEQMAVVSSKCEIELWKLPGGEFEGTIEGKWDIQGGRGKNEKFTARNSSGNKRFNTIAYSPDGRLLIAAGESKYACVYELSHKVLLHKYSFTENRSLSGILYKLNSKEEGENDEWESELNLEGIPDAFRPGNILKRKSERVRASKVIYTEDGRNIALVTVEGLLVYSSQEQDRFLPIDLDSETSKETVVASLVEEKFTEALIESIRLGEEVTIQEVLYRIPEDEVEGTVEECVGKELIRLIEFLTREFGRSYEIGLLLIWVNFVCKYHFGRMKGRVELKALLRSVYSSYSKLASFSSSNFYTLSFLIN